MRIRVLVVEDDPIQAELARHVLQAHDCYVDIVADGLSAIHKVAVGCFDVVLMDYAIPDLDGLGVARVISAIETGAARPRLVALSATPAAIRRREAGKESVFDQIEGKPWTPESLVAAVVQGGARDRWAAGPALGAGPVGARTGATMDERPRPAGLLAQTSHRILLVDDDGALRSVLALSLRAAGYSVEEAPDGLEAVRLSLVTPFDVILIDYHLPEIDGFTLGRLLFDLLTGPARPRLVALTAARDALIEREGQDLSMFDEIVPKQLGLKPVLDAIDRCADYQVLRSRVDPPDVMRFDAMVSLVGARIQA